MLMDECFLATKHTPVTLPCQAYAQDGSVLIGAVLKGHGFSRAEERPKNDAGFSP
jgi:hypothetical protein